MATILDLLMALNRGDLPPLPDPAKPVGMPLPVGAPPVMTMPAGPPPDLPPTAPLPPQDLNLINQIAGAAPTPPAPLSRTQRIFNALAGFGAGFQGNGAQFLAQLQEPQREYQQQLERYQGRRTQGIEFATQKQQREQDRVQRQAEAQAEREFNVWLKKTGVQDQMAIEQMRNAFQLEQDARKTAENERKERVLLRRQIALQIDDRIKAYRDQGADKHAEELARSDFRMALEQLGEKVPPLSAAAAKANTLVQAKIQRALRLVQGGGTGGGNDAKMVEQFENLKRQLYPARERGDVTQESSVMRRIEAVGAKLQAKGYEVGYGDNPYVKPPGGATAQPAQPQIPTTGVPGFSFESMLQAPSYVSQPQGQKFSRAQVNSYARKNKRKPADVEADLKARGFTVE